MKRIKIVKKNMFITLIGQKRKINKKNTFKYYLSTLSKLKILGYYLSQFPYQILFS